MTWKVSKEGCKQSIYAVFDTNRVIPEYFDMEDNIVSDIKTKETVKDIKALDRSAAALRKVKRATVRTKDQIENLIDDGQVTPSEYAEDQVKYAAEDTSRAVYDKTAEKMRQGRDRVKEQIRETRAEKKLEHQKERADIEIERFENAQVKESSVRSGDPKKARPESRKTVHRARSVKKAAVRTRETVANNKAVQGQTRQIRSAVQTKNTSIRTAQATERSIKQTAKSTGKATVKTSRHSAKTAQRTVKTAEQTSKAAIKTTKVAAEAAPKAAEATAKAAKATAIAARKAAIAVGKAVVAASKVIAKAAVAAGKAIASAVSALAAAVGAGGAVAIIAVVIICAVGLVLGSAEGIFFSSEDTGGRTMQSVVRDINQEYQDRLELIKEVNTYDEIEMTGSSAVWREVLSVYAVSLNMASDEEQEVVTLSDEKIELLKDIFWQMNTISSGVEDVTKTVVVEQVDEEGNVTEVEVEKEIKLLKITISHRTAAEMAEDYHFTEKQKSRMNDLLFEKNRSLWAAVLYGIKSGETAIIDVAASQLGNVGGEPYWSWFGFTSRIEWCACFVSWCGNECGYIDDGIMPKAIGCVVMMNWYKQRGQWIDGNEEPVPGMIIFYDWDDPDGEFGPQDGKPDHTGIVEKVENGIVWTIEGNSADSCRRNQHSVGEYVILGYGCPKY